MALENLEPELGHSHPYARQTLQISFNSSVVSMMFLVFQFLWSSSKMEANCHGAALETLLDWGRLEIVIKMKKILELNWNFVMKPESIWQGEH